MNGTNSRPGRRPHRLSSLVKIVDGFLSSASLRSEARSLLLREGDEMRVFGGLALRAALQGRLPDSARIVGYADAALARAGAVSEKTWTTLSDRLGHMLRAGLAPGELSRLQAEGAAMREEDAVRLALGTG